MPIEGTITPAASPTAPSIGGAAPGVATVKFSEGVAPAVQPAPAAEPPKPEEKPAAPKEIESWRLAALAQKEKALREQAAAAKGDRAAAEQARAEAIRLQTEIAQRQQVYRQNPMALLQDHGYDYDTVTRFVAQGGWSPEEQQAAMLAAQQRAIQALAQQREQDRQEDAQRRAAEQKAAEERAQQAQQQAEQAAVAEFKEELSSFVKAEPDTYEMIGLAGPNALEAVYEKIEEHYKKTGQRLSNKDAADAVEADLVKEAERVVEASKKLKSRFGPAPAPAPATLAARIAAAPKTLSNNLQAAAPPAPREAPRNETETERRARVIAQIQAAMGARK